MGAMTMKSTQRAVDHSLLHFPARSHRLLSRLVLTPLARLAALIYSLTHSGGHVVHSDSGHYILQKYFTVARAQERCGASELASGQLLPSRFQEVLNYCISHSGFE